MRGSLWPAKARPSEQVASRGRFYFGWIVVGASVLLMAGILGTQLCFGVFLPILETEFGWGREAISGAMSFSLGVGGVIGIMMGRFSDRYNMWAVVAVGTITGAASYFLLSTTESLWHLYVYFGVLNGISTGCIYAPVIATVSKWFSRKRTLAIGLAMAGIMLGGMTLPPAISHVIGSEGWQAGYRTLAVVVLVTGVLGATVMTRKPPSVGHSPGVAAEADARVHLQPRRDYTVREAARTAPFWMLMITGFAIAFNFYFVVAHIVSCGTDAHLSYEAASWILTISGLGSVAGTLSVHWFTARLGGRLALLVLCLAMAAPVFLFIPATRAWYFYLVAVFFGFLFGAVGPTRMSLVPPLFGLKSVGAVLGWATFFWSMGGIVGPYLAGYIYEATKSPDGVGGSYDVAFLVGGLLLLVAAVSVYLWGSHKKDGRPGRASEGEVGKA